MLAAPDRVGTGLVEVPTVILWRLIDGRSRALEALRHDEEQRVAHKALPPIGYLTAVTVG